MAQATPIVSPSAHLLPVNELPKQPTLAEELAKALDEDTAEKPARKARKPRRGRS